MSEKRFVFAVRAYVKENGRPANMVTKTFCWHNPFTSFMGRRVSNTDNVFVFESNCNLIELQHLQFMAMCEGPDIKDGMNILSFGVNIKDIHITTGRLDIIDVIESKPGVMSESYDSAQPSVKLILETCELPEKYKTVQYQKMNSEASRYIQEILPKLKPLDQSRVDRLNDAMVAIASDSASMIQNNGFQYHKEGVLSGNCLTVWNNTVDLNMVFLHNALENKIKNHYPCPADSFGLVMSCLKICGVGINDAIDGNVAESFMRSFPCYISTAITYASDIKKDPNSGSYEMSEDISTPMSDNVYDDKAYCNQSIQRVVLSKKHGLRADGGGFKGLKRSYHDSVFYDDCEGDASILKICFGMVQKICQGAARMTGACDHEKLATNIKNYSIMQDWSKEEIQKGLLQCKQLNNYIKDSSIELLLMSAKAPNVEKSNISDGKPEVGYDICGHCAAMTKHNGNLYLAEMTAPVYMIPNTCYSEPIQSSASKETSLKKNLKISSSQLDRLKKSYDKMMEMKRLLKEKTTGNTDFEITEESFYAQLCNDCAPNIVRSRVWLHMKKMDDVFWHIGGIMGDKMLISPDNKTVGVPVSDMIKENSLSKLKAININLSKEEKEEFDFISAYATPPILPYIKVFETKVAPPLKNSIYPSNMPTIPLVYSAQSIKDIKNMGSWVNEDTESRFTCTIGNKLLGIQLMPRVDLKMIEQHTLPVKTKFCLH